MKNSHFNIYFICEIEQTKSQQRRLSNYWKTTAALIKRTLILKHQALVVYMEYCCMYIDWATLLSKALVSSVATMGMFCIVPICPVSSKYYVCLIKHPCKVYSMLTVSLQYQFFFFKWISMQPLTILTDFQNC